MAQLAIRYDFRNPAFVGTTMAERYACALDQIEWAEAHGFASVTLSEHHGCEDGYLPSALTFAAAIAARTERIRIRIAAIVPALHDPVRVAEQVALVDHLSHGRLDLVLTNGYVPAEFAAVGDDVTNRVKRLTEAVRVIRQAASGEPFEFRGRMVRVTPATYQQPGVPLWLGGASEPAARRAARLGDGFMPSYPELWDIYRDELRVLGKPDPGAIPQGTIAYLHISEDLDATWARVAPHALHEMNEYGKWAAESGAATGYQPIEDADTLRTMGIYSVITPDQCVEIIRGLGEHGAFILHPLMGGVPPELAWENLRAFETKVLPRL
jgi:alkanesulfonate monooxygenase SsuD/methylene tetrahydromethanopterin reductase-like flavin-dependent oxidoreductase (luciferase family)